MHSRTIALSHLCHRTRRVLTTALTVGTIGLVLTGCDPADAEALRSSNDTATSVTTTVPAESSAPATPAATAPAGRDDASAAEDSEPSDGVGVGAGAALVTRVIDGDTFVVQGGDRVRVLGIDSCEASTSAGPAATAAARGVLEGQVVHLRRESGVDRDRYGRLLRYVEVPGTGDLGRYMVTDGSHTGVYQGRNDASPAYVAQLRAAAGARSCGADTTTTSTSTTGARPTSTPQRAVEQPPAKTTTPQRAAPKTTSGSSGGGGAFKNCRAAWAAGAAPVHRGDPGYGSHLDRDGDGIGCEVRPN